MTTEEAKKAGFRTSESGWATTWRILTTNEIHRLHSKVRGLDSKDFPTRAKAREALRKCKIEAATKREEARVAVRKAAGTQVPPPTPSETPADNDARIKALVDGYKAKGGPITKEQLTDEVRKWCYNSFPGVPYWSFYNPQGDIDQNIEKPWHIGETKYPSDFNLSLKQAFWNKSDAEHAKWLDDMQSQTTPITQEQGEVLRDGDRIYGFKYGCVDAEHLVCFENPVTVGCVDDTGIIKAGKAYFTLTAVQAALDKAKDVESHETPVGETQAKEVVTDETQPTILEEAAKCVTGPRRRDYGTPDENFSLIASLWSVQIKHEVTPMQVAMCLILLKVARQSNSPKRDNLVDIAGYAQCASELKGAK